MRISSSTPSLINNSNNANIYEYRSKPQKDMFRISFNDKKSNKKVEINIDKNLLERLKTKFQGDIDIKERNVKVKGELKNYLETMWKKFHYDRDFKDLDGDGYLNATEFMRAKAGVSFQSLADSVEDDEVKWDSENDTLNLLNFSQLNRIKRKEQIQKEIDQNREIYTLEGFFLGFIEEDRNLDAKVTNKEEIEDIKGDLGEDLTNYLLAVNSQKLNLKSSILQAIIEMIEKKKDEVVNDLVSSDGVKIANELSAKEKVELEKDPLGYILKNS